MPLAEARKERDKARDLLKAGTDPSTARKLGKARSTISTDTGFEAVAREWHKAKAIGWAQSHADTTIRRLEKDVFPWIGTRPMPEIDAPELLASPSCWQCCAGLKHAAQSRRLIGCARSSAKCSASGSPPASQAQPSRRPAGHAQDAAQPPCSDRRPEAVADLVRAMRGYRGAPVVRTALQFPALVFQRPGEVRAATWAEIDLDGGMWTIPAARMKRSVDQKANGQPHLVPLSTQAVQLLRELHPLTATMASRAVFSPASEGRGAHSAKTACAWLCGPWATTTTR